MDTVLSLFSADDQVPLLYSRVLFMNNIVSSAKKGLGLINKTVTCIVGYLVPKTKAHIFHYEENELGQKRMFIYFTVCIYAIAGHTEAETHTKRSVCLHVPNYIIF